MNRWFYWLKKHFVPHQENEHRPHVLRDLSARNLVTIILLLEIFSFLIPTISQLSVSGGMAAVLPAILSALTNNKRQAQNLNTLSVNQILNKAAQLKAEDMATLGYFAHVSPEGKTPWYWIEKVGYKYQYAGENLAINFNDSIDVANAWINSPTHKANIVKENYTEMGTGVATGVYQGRQSVFVAQIYANPLPIVLKVTNNKKPIVVKTIKVSTTIKKEPGDVLGVETTGIIKENSDNNIIKEPTFIQKLLASPRNTTQKILFVIFTIVGIALFLYIFIKRRNHHRDLITNGLTVLALLGAFLLANYYVSHSDMLILDNFAYSKEQK